MMLVSLQLKLCSGLLTCNKHVSTAFHRSWTLELDVPLLLLICVGLQAGMVMLTMHDRKDLVGSPESLHHYSFL